MKSHYLAILLLVSSSASGQESAHVAPVHAQTPEDESNSFLLPLGYKMQLVLSEPEIAEPVVTAFDGDGRMFVAEMRTYMQDIDGKGEKDETSRISLHISTKGDGNYDKHTVFADHLKLPRMILPLGKGQLLVNQSDTSDIELFTDTNDDGVADKREIWFKGGPRGGNMEHQPSGLIWALDNGIYTTYNTYRLRWTPQGPEKEDISPNGGQWGLNQDNNGNLYFVNASGEQGPNTFQVPPVYGNFNPRRQFADGFRELFPAAGVRDFQGGPGRVREPQGTLNGFTSGAGIEVYRGDQLPAELLGDVFFGEPVGRLVRRAKVALDGTLKQLSNPYQSKKSEFLRSTDLCFRPVNLTNAPDGTLYITDMYRGIIQEASWVNEGSYLRKVVQQYQLDQIIGRGRIWRLVHESSKPTAQPRMYEETSSQLVEHLGHPNGWWRDTAQRLLIIRQDFSVVPLLENMVRDDANPFARLHALWTLQGLNRLKPELVREKMADDDPRLRANAIRVCESLYRSGDTSFQADIVRLSKDPDPSVVLQSLLTAKYLAWPGHMDFITPVVVNSKDPGMDELGSYLILPPDRDNHEFNDQERAFLKKGAAIFSTLCASCHGTDAKEVEVAGVKGAMIAPPLAGSATINGHPNGGIDVLLKGIQGPIGGKTYEGLMISMADNDDEWIASVLSYVRTHFGNSASWISPADVASERKRLANRKIPWTESELIESLPQWVPSDQMTVTASDAPEGAGLAIDGKMGSRYSTNRFMRPGMWFGIELKQPTRISGVMLDTTPSSNDFPRGYRLEVSTDGNDWSEISKVTGNQGPVTDIQFAPTLAKKIRITQLGSSDSFYWSIHELHVSEARD
ncbi:discoidin domain-containing protein [Luteolibacter pohnpeiensis]|uniref:Discoidin domain-containing protein n=1 Tax=Luteolibacter pohnpeiensis TaxID=454153 RepID=A0A934S6T0_9BACT|nr:discoidin domain-containing protein [Luteolibacter pohnpeiensis]MBK1883277.1 discoidin domain-containing protein [Luteolibacter pohnpeiensis]